MPLMRRAGRPGLIGTAARTAVITGTAGAVAQRQERRAQERYGAAQQADAPAPASGVPTGDDLTSQLQRLGELHAAGTLSDEEFAAAKARLLG